MNLAAEQQFPTKWPFPPVPPARRAWNALRSRLRGGRPQGWAAVVTGAPAASAGAPARASYAGAASVRPSLPATAARAAAAPSLSPAAAAADAGAGDVTLRQMVVDILLVVMWGAMIPALMWLGAAAGF